MGMTRIMGIDPGSTENAWCIIDAVAHAPGRYVAHGKGTVDEVVALLRGRSDLVRLALETPSAFIPRGNTGPGASFSQASALLTMMANVGEIRRACKDLGLERVELTAGQWRVAVVGTIAVKDAQIKAAVVELVHGWPKMSQSHHRDAAGVALACGWGIRPTVKAA